MRTASFLAAAAAILAGCAGIFAPELRAQSSDLPAGAVAANVEIGRNLSAIGSCETCHTAPGGAAFAGGRGVVTPFGTIHSTNITPDPATGIGGWSRAAFADALRNGRARDGSHLYPAHPYDHFTGMVAADIDALYDYILTRPPVRKAATRNDLAFPYNVRALLGVWNFAFLDRSLWRVDASADAETQRGAYLVETVGHCGACHAPRNVAGARSGKTLAGGMADGWEAPGLGTFDPAPIKWTKEALVDYLSDGWHPHHGTAAGPMRDVVRGLAQAAPSDIRAMAAYLTRGTPAQDPVRTQAALEAARARDYAGPSANPNAGERIFARACAGCHRAGSQTVPMALYAAVNAASPGGFIRATLAGVPSPRGSMPGFAASLSDAELAELAAYARARFASGPAWTDLPAAIKAAR